MIRVPFLEHILSTTTSRISQGGSLGLTAELQCAGPAREGLRSTPVTHSRSLPELPRYPRNLGFRYVDIPNNVSSMQFRTLDKRGTLGLLLVLVCGSVRRLLYDQKQRVAVRQHVAMQDLHVVGYRCMENPAGLRSRCNREEVPDSEGDREHAPKNANDCDLIHIHRERNRTLGDIPRNMMREPTAKAVENVMLIGLRFRLANLSNDFGPGLVCEFDDRLIKRVHFVLIGSLPDPKESLSAWREQLDGPDYCVACEFVLCLRSGTMLVKCSCRNRSSVRTCQFLLLQEMCAAGT